MKRRRELGYMPKGKVFYVDGKPELCSATGYEVCEDDSNLLSKNPYFRYKLSNSFMGDD